MRRFLSINAERAAELLNELRVEHQHRSGDTVVADAHPRLGSVLLIRPRQGEAILIVET